MYPSQLASSEMEKSSLRGRRSRFWGRLALGYVKLKIFRHSNGDVRWIVGYLSLAIDLAFGHSL